MNRNYGVISVTLLSAGIIGAVWADWPALFWLLGLILACGVGFTTVILNRHLRARCVMSVLMGIAVFCGGGFWMAQAREGYRGILRHDQASHDRVVTIQGVVIERPEESLFGWRCNVAVKNSEKAALQGKITVYSKTAKVAWYGHRLQLTGRFKTPPGKACGLPGLNERRGSAGRIAVTSPPLLLPGNGLPYPFIWADRVRSIWMGAGRRYLSRENAGLLHAMVYGAALETGRAARRLLMNLRRTGTVHLLSVSGLHIGFVVGGFSLLLGLCKVPRRLRVIPLGLVTGFYILMTGMDPPVLRAGMMMLLYLCGQFLDIRDSSLNRLGLAAALLLLRNPYDLFEVGFQLSVLATLGVVWLAPLLGRSFPVSTGSRKIPWETPRILRKTLRILGEALRISVAAQLAVLPVLIYYFQQISWSGPLVNLLLLAPAWLAVVGGLSAELLGAVLPQLGAWLFYPVDVCLTVIRRIVTFGGEQAWAAGWSPPWPWPWIAGYYLALFLSLERLQPNLISGRRLRVRRGPAIIGVLLAANLILWPVWYTAAAPQYLELVMVDVGQGDSFLLRAPDGQAALVDGGPPGQGSRRVLPFLRAHGIERLNLVIVTHAHRDHLGGVMEVLEEIPAERVIVTATTAALLKKRLGANLQLAKWRPGTVLRLGRQVGLELWQAVNQGDENNRSLVAVVNFAKNKLLLTGDLEQRGEAILERKNPLFLRAGVLKVGHHGSNNATGLSFLTRVRPRVALISAGAGNRFGHPGAGTLNRLHSLGVRVFRTDTAGTVHVRLYPEKTVVLVDARRKG